MAAELTRALDVRWPRWTWVVLPALAIAIGGSAGYIVGGGDDEPRAQAVHQAQPIVEPIETRAPAAAQPDEEIEVEPTEAAKPAARGTTRPAVSRPKPHKPKVKSAPCNVYDHMDGC